MATTNPDPRTLSILTGYARGGGIASIAADTGVGEDIVAGVIATTANHNRAYARELVRRHLDRQRVVVPTGGGRDGPSGAPPATRPGAGRAVGQVVAPARAPGRSRFADTGHRRRGAHALAAAGSANQTAATAVVDVVDANPTPPVPEPNAAVATESVVKPAAPVVICTVPELGEDTVSGERVADAAGALLVGGSQLCAGCGSTSTAAGVCCATPTTPVRIEIHSDGADERDSTALQVWTSRLCERCGTAEPTAITCCRTPTTPVRVELHAKAL